MIHLDNAHANDKGGDSAMSEQEIRDEEEEEIDEFCSSEEECEEMCMDACDGLFDCFAVCMNECVCDDEQDE